MKANRINWPYKLPEKLAIACGKDLSAIRNEVQCGICHLYHLTSKNTDILVVTRGEEVLEHKELVIVCVAGHGMKEVGQFLIDNARSQGFDSIRYHCQDAVQRLYSQYGFAGKEIERVYRVEVGG